MGSSTIWLMVSRMELAIVVTKKTLTTWKTGDPQAGTGTVKRVHGRHKLYFCWIAYLGGQQKTGLEILFIKKHHKRKPEQFRDLPASLPIPLYSVESINHNGNTDSNNPPGSKSSGSGWPAGSATRPGSLPASPAAGSGEAGCS